MTCYNGLVNDPSLQAVLLDLDGVLYVGEQTIPGAQGALAMLRQAGYGLRGITNTTTMPRRAVAEKLARLGLALSERELATPATLAVRAIGSDRAAHCIRASRRQDFAEIREDAAPSPRAGMGDTGGPGHITATARRLTHPSTGSAGAPAAHKNRFWQKPDGLHLDLGAFVAAIECATGRDATVLGKPSPDFFRAVCADLGTDPGHCLMVGDDIESDIGGAQRVGMRTVLVQTGKYREAQVHTCMDQGIRPDRILPSIAELPQTLA